jgi:hypothetical protein
VLEIQKNWYIRFRGFRLTQLYFIVVYYFIQIIRYMFRSYDHLQVEIYTFEITTKIQWDYGLCPSSGILND